MMTNQTFNLPADSAAYLAVLTAISKELRSIRTFLQEGLPAMSTVRATSAPSVEPVAQEVTLPNFVSHQVRISPVATRLFVDTLRRVGQYVGRNLTKHQMNQPEFQPYIGWKWHLLYHALVHLSLIDAHTTHSAFADLICLVLPDKKPANISRSFYRNYDKNESIIADIEDVFRPVIQ
jgi:hypothetical protein